MGSRLTHRLSGLRRRSQRALTTDRLSTVLDIAGTALIVIGIQQILGNGAACIAAGLAAIAASFSMTKGGKP